MFFFRIGGKEPRTVQVKMFLATIRSVQELDDHNEKVNEFLVSTKARGSVLDVRNVVNIVSPEISSVFTIVEYKYGRIDQMIGGIKSIKVPEGKITSKIRRIMDFKVFGK
jgi:hypothetical protein